MINFTRYNGPLGIPVYYQELPEAVEAVALDWVIFTGSADDELVGTEGAYHWFEHVPFRGTKRFPAGYKATKGPFTPYAGSVGAWTNSFSTNYSAFVHQSQWQLGLDVITDLWCQPLLQDEAIEAEREIIFEEIRGKNANVRDKPFYILPRLLWPGHPMGHATLGSAETLNSISPNVLRTAHRLGYDHRRSSLLVSGNLKVDEVLQHLSTLAELFPDNQLSERRSSRSWDDFPTWRTERVIEDTEFASTIVLVLFPVPTLCSVRDKLIREPLISGLVSLGRSSSPLYRIIREKHKLAYRTNTVGRFFPNGGYYGVSVETSRGKISETVEAVEELFKDEYLRSRERFEEVKLSLRYKRRMSPIDPTEFNSIAIQDLVSTGKIINDEDEDKILESFSFEEAQDMLDRLTPELARTFIFRGRS